MDTDELVVFREFQDKELLQECQDLLQEYDIPFYVEDTKPRFDVTFANDDSQRFYRIRVQPADLERAQQLSAELDRDLFAELPSDYYLFQFTDDELIEVVHKIDEWSSFDVLLAEKLLVERGVKLDPEELEQSRQERIALLDAPDKEGKIMILAGYLFAFMGGLLGLMIGLILLNAKKTTHAGLKVHRYSERARKNGMNMVLIFFAVLGIAIIYALIQLV